MHRPLGLNAQARLKLEWRRFLTQQMLQAYFSRRAFFKLKLQAAGIDNPDQVGRPSTWSGRSRLQLFTTSLDHATSVEHSTAQLRCSEAVTGTDGRSALLQRICDDVPAFADTSVFLVLGITRKFFNCVAFAGGCTNTPG